MYLRLGKMPRSKCRTSVVARKNPRSTTSACPIMHTMRHFLAAGREEGTEASLPHLS
jgi:hypothetical protein